MEAKAKLFGHPIHPMLIVFPLGLFTTAAVFDVVTLITGNGRWSEMAMWLMLVGVAGGVGAALFGLIDYLAIPGGTRARRVGLLHGLGNVVVVAMFVWSWLLHRQHPADPVLLAHILSIGGAALGAITSWLGGELVGRLGVAVDDGANLNAPSSLSGRPARGTEV